MLRVSALVGLLAGCLMAYTLLLNPGLRHLCVAMAALGVYRGVYNPPLESIFADSVRAGRRWVDRLPRLAVVLQSTPLQCTLPGQAHLPPSGCQLCTLFPS